MGKFQLLLRIDNPVQVKQIYSISRQFKIAKMSTKNRAGHFKGIGTRDLIWLKVVSLDRSWLVGLTDNLKKFLKCCFIFLIIFFKFSGTGKNHAYCKCE